MNKKLVELKSGWFINPDEYKEIECKKVSSFFSGLYTECHLIDKQGWLSLRNFAADDADVINKNLSNYFKEKSKSNN